MSPYQQPLAPATSVDLTAASLNAFERLSAIFPIKRDTQEKWATAAIVNAQDLHAAVLFLRDTPELAYDMLIDVVGIDYLHYEGYQGPRFAVVYLLKSMQYAAHRFQLKVLVDEEDLHVPTITDLYQIADWAEREVYDQFGILFDGHPNLKRLLNHFEFVGHPLRKDYPAQKRQWLSTNDPMIDQLELRLKQNGIAVLDPMPLNTPAVEDLIQGDRL